jgi:hypothetical protein
MYAVDVSYIQFLGQIEVYENELSVVKNKYNNPKA